MIEWDNYNVDSEGKLYYDFFEWFFSSEIEWKEIL